MMKKPKFVESNLAVLQIRQDRCWVDYASIKDKADFTLALSKTVSQPDLFRIVRKQMGITPIYEFRCEAGKTPVRIA